MKNIRFYSTIVTAMAVGTLILICNADAQPGKMFARYGRRVEDSNTAGKRTLPLASKAKNLANDKLHAKPEPRQVASYTKYRLIDLGTLGGSNAGVWGIAVQLNNLGEAIAQLSTAVHDPYDPNCLSDCFVWHGVVGEKNGAVTDLGALPGVNTSVPVCITENGLIAGLSENGLIDPLTDFPQVRAVLWNRDRTIVDLGTLGGNASQGFAANTRGQVVGLALNGTPENPDFAGFMNDLGGVLPAAQQVRAFLWQNGSMRDLGTLGGNDAAATMVNDRGQIAGYSFTDTTPNETTGLPTVHPFLWSNGTMRDLGSLGGTLSMPGSFNLWTTGQVLNDSGEVVGTSTLDGDEVWHAFVWTNGTMIDLGTLGGSSEATAINNRGQVLGRAVVTDTPFVRHAFLWEKGEMTDLGAVAPCTRSTAVSINSANQIVGSLGACTDNENDPSWFSAFYMEKGKPMVDINTLITPTSDIHLDGAWNINNRGEIFANGFLPDGSGRVVLLVPVPGR